MIDLMAQIKSYIYFQIFNQVLLHGCFQGSTAALNGRKDFKFILGYTFKTTIKWSILSLTTNAIVLQTMELDRIYILAMCIFTSRWCQVSHTEHENAKPEATLPPHHTQTHNPNLLIFMHKYKMGNSPSIYIFKWNTLYTHYLPICPYMIQMEYSSIVNWYVSAFTYRELYEVLFAWMGPGALECSLRSFLIENTVVSFQSYIFRLAASSSICLLCPWHWCSAYLILHSFTLPFMLPLQNSRLFCQE